ncbi:Hypothetical predicted protein [Paramuricea clavata]|uniref:Uncharacterized protein n=1 Tax=Paramuricea clavata TaxID=317549 RepID=A0A6S7HS14_PARCT|nr:Hypothetical predicted protein [Paramuricea clavata]
MIHSDKPELTVESVTWKSVDVSSFNHDIAASDLCTKPPNDLEDLVACNDTTLEAVLEKHAPSKTKIIVKRPRVPWFNEQLRKAKRERRKAERKWRLAKLQSDFSILKIKRNAVNRLIATAQTEYYANIVEENKGEQRKLFKTCTITNIRSQLDNNELSSLPDDPQIAFPETESNVPHWKEALVHPLLKKIGIEATFMNFRPVSNLPFISKLPERAVFEQTRIHMVDNDLYPSAQSSYRRNHSNETVLLKVKNDILMNVNEQHVSFLVLLDMSAAFDTVDHRILLGRLSSKFCFTGGASSWFRSYLSQRSQRIAIRGISF